MAQCADASRPRDRPRPGSARVHAVVDVVLATHAPPDRLAPAHGRHAGRDPRAHRSREHRHGSLGYPAHRGGEPARSLSRVGLRHRARSAVGAGGVAARGERADVGVVRQRHAARRRRGAAARAGRARAARVGARLARRQRAGDGRGLRRRHQRLHRPLPSRRSDVARRTGHDRARARAVAAGGHVSHAVGAGAAARRGPAGAGRGAADREERLCRGRAAAAVRDERDLSDHSGQRGRAPVRSAKAGDGRTDGRRGRCRAARDAHARGLAHHDRGARHPRRRRARGTRAGTLGLIRSA